MSLRNYHHATQIRADAGTATVSLALGITAFRYDCGAIVDDGAASVVGVAIFTATLSNGDTQAFSVDAGLGGPNVRHFDGPGITAMTVSAPASTRADVIIWW